LALIVRQKSHFAQHLRMSDRATDIVDIEPAIESHTLGELLDTPIRRFVKDSAPGLLCHWHLQRNDRGPDKDANILTLNGLGRGVNEECGLCDGRNSSVCSLQESGDGQGPDADLAKFAE